MRRVRSTPSRVIAASVLAFALSPSPAHAQPFTRNLTGDAVSDASYSEGALWNDLDLDGDLDLVVANIVGQPNLLYENVGGTLVRILTGDPTEDGGFTYGGGFVDLDGDAAPDLVLVNGGAAEPAATNFYYRNDGAGNLLRDAADDLATDPGGSWSAATADVDLDGDLDVFVTGFNQADALYENQGDGTFVRVVAGVPWGTADASLGCAFADLDDDGYPDLVVARANFAGGRPNGVYRNDGDGTFTAIGSGAIATDVANSVGVSIADVDGDLDPDVFVTNYFGEANALYRNDGGFTFTSIGAIPPVTDGGSSVGADFGDSDLDGDLDLFVSNDLDENNRLYRNDGDLVFTPVEGSDVVSDGGRSNGSTWVDVDADGDLDLFVTNGDQPVSQSNFLYRNDLPAGPSWLQVRLAGVVSNRDGVGATVTVHAVIGGEASAQFRQVLGQTGYNAQAPLDVELGLGDATGVDSVVVRWPSGIRQVLAEVAVNQRLEVVEAAPVDVPDGGGPVIVPVPSEIDLAPHPWRDGGRLRIDEVAAGPVRVVLADVTGREVAILHEGAHGGGRMALELATGGVAPGVYAIRVEAGGRRLERRLVITR